MPFEAVELEQRQQARLCSLLIPHRGPGEMIVGVRSLNIDSAKGEKHYARSYPSGISRTNRL